MTRNATSTTRVSRVCLLWLVATLAFASLPSAKAQLSGILGQATNCASGANTINFPAEGVSLSFVASAVGQVTLLGVLAAPAGLPAGCAGPLRFGLLGTNVGYTVLTSAGLSLSGVQIITPAIHSSTQGLIGAGGAVAGCLQYDAITGTFVRVAGAVYDAATLKITLPMPSIGTYIFSAISSSVSLAAGAQANLAGQCGQTVSWASGVALQYGSSAANQITCTVASAPSVGASALAGVGTSLGAFINFAASTAAAHTSTISYTYTAAQLAAAGIVDEARLRIAFYDSGCGCWQFPAAGASVDVAARVVTQVGVAANSLQPCAIFELPYAAGAQVALAANKFACLTYSIGAQLRATASVATSVALDVVASAPASLPAGCTDIDFQGGVQHVGYVITSANAAALGAVQLSTAAVSAASASVIAQAGNTAGCLQATAGGYVRVAVQAYTAANGVISVQLANAVSGAQYVFAAVAANIQAQVGAAVNVAGNAQQSIQWGAQIGLNFASSAANTITCTAASVPSVGAAAAAQAGVAIGAFLNFALASAQQHTSTITYVYTQAQLQAAGVLDAAALRIGFWDSGCGCWQFPSTGLIVNTATNTITQIVSGVDISPCGVFGPIVQLALGSNININSGSATLNFLGGAQLSFTSSGSATISLNGITSVGAALPAGCVAVASGAANHVGFYIQSSAAVLSNVILTTPQIAASGVAAITAAGGASAVACLQLAGSVYNRIAIQSYVNGAITFAVGSATSGQQFILAAVASSVQASLGQAISVAGNANQELRWGAQVSLQFASNVANTITCTASSAPTVGANLIGAGAALGAYLNFAVSNAVAAHTSTIVYAFTQAQLQAAGIVDAARLRIAFYDSGCGCWQFPTTGAAVNVAAGIVSQAVAGAGFAACGIFELPYAAGAAIQVQGAQLVNAVLTSGARVSVTVSAATNLVLSEVNSPPSPMPIGCGAVQFPSASNCVGFALSSSNSVAVLANAVITTPAVSAAAAAAIAATGSAAGCLRATANGYVRVAIQSYANGLISLALPTSGGSTCDACDGSAFVFAAIQAQVAASYGQAVAIAGNAQQTIQFGSQLAIQYVSAQANTLTCTLQALPSQGAAVISSAGIALGAFVNLQLATAASHTTTISYTYTALQLTLAGIVNAAGLKFGFYNSGCNCWQFPGSGASVNVAAKVVTQVYAGSGSLPYCGVFLPPLFKLDQVIPAVAGFNSFDFEGGLQLSFDADLALNVAFRDLTEAGAALPQGCQTVVFASNSQSQNHIGYELVVTGGSIENVNIVTSAASASSLSLLSNTAAYTAAAFRASAAGVVYARAKIASYETASGRFVVQDCIGAPCSEGRWVFGVLPALPQATNAAAYPYCSYCNQTVQYGQNVRLTYRSALANSVSVAETADTTVDSAVRTTARANLGLALSFIAISGQSQADAAASAGANAHVSSFVWAYDRTALAAQGVTDFDKLRVLRFEQSCSCWQQPPSPCSVNQQAKTVQQDDADYGTYGVFYAEASAEHSAAPASAAPATVLLALLPLMALALKH